MSTSSGPSDFAAQIKAIKNDDLTGSLLPNMEKETTVAAVDLRHTLRPARPNAIWKSNLVNTVWFCMELIHGVHHLTQ
jgi:hypothetical protein